MKLVETHDIEQGYDEYNGKGSLTVTLVGADGKDVASAAICAGEPEDATFFRDLNGAYSIAELVQAAYEAGKRGETLEYEFIDESEAA
ncbi:hypothetical protein [Paenibacillus odorifer]|uniref:hypothetical protein n=1 Tax=Paenibacillus odorifer TaxID=189426 RepID=UPI00096D393C|nr:hypothetical protein [Paenibacillus odorifer]OMD16245.1 hypothetical protein BJP50_18585 [Paenibacillus odorifer]